MRTLLIISVGIAVVIGAWVVAAVWTDIDFERLGQVGDTLGPIVGCLSLLAVLAALDSLRLQSEALGLQRTALTEQRESLHNELEIQRSALKLQAEAIEAQQKALQTEITLQRHAALGSAYARLFGALDAYRAEVFEYLTWIGANASDKKGRRNQREPVETKYEEVRLAKWAVHFVDADRERERIRDAITLHHELEPSGGDTTETQRAHAHTMHEKLTKEIAEGNELREHLFREIGFRPVADASSNK